MFTGVLTCRFAGAQLGVHAQLTSLSPESGKATFVVTGQARARKAEIAEMTEKKIRWQRLYVSAGVLGKQDDQSNLARLQTLLSDSAARGLGSN